MTDQPEHDPLGDLAAAGVAVWLDDLSRELLAGGGLQALIASRHVVGVTSNRSQSPSRSGSCLAGVPERSWVAWSPAVLRRGLAVFGPGLRVGLGACLG
jgi:hypothetical protein